MIDGGVSRAQGSAAEQSKFCTGVQCPFKVAGRLSNNASFHQLLDLFIVVVCLPQYEILSLLPGLCFLPLF